MPPIERSARLFKQCGWQVSFLGVRAKGAAARLTSTLHFEDEIEYLDHRPGGFKALWSYLRFWGRAWQRARRERPDVIYISDILAYPAGLLIALSLPGLTVLHEHDTPTEHKGIWLRFLHMLRRRFARRADIIVIPQAARAARMRDLTGRSDIVVAFNCPLLEELPRALALKKKSDGLILWHHGSLGPGRIPLTIIKALAQTPSDVKLALAGYETPGI